MKIIFYSFILYFSFINLAHALPVPVLVLSSEVFIFLGPIVLGVLATIFYYFNKYIYSINFIILFINVALYGFHFYLTGDYLLNKYEFVILTLYFFLLILDYKFVSKRMLTYLFLIISVILCYFLLIIDKNIYNFYQFKNEYEKESNTNIERYILNDNSIILYIPPSKKIIISNCLEGNNISNKGVLLRGYTKENDKLSTVNGLCIYGEFGQEEYNYIRNAILKTGNIN